MKLISYSILLLACLHLTKEKSLRRNKRSLHVPPIGAPSFIRTAVEQPPILDASYTKATYRDVSDFGSRSLPLRAAVESIPNIKDVSRRLPLRDAVEKRPPPDEAFEFEPLDTQRSPTFRSNIPFTIYDKYLLFQSYLAPLGYSQAYTLSEPVNFRKQGQKSLDRYFNTAAERDSKLIVCYVEGIAVYRKQPFAFSINEIDPSACTHVIYAFAAIDPHTYQIISQDEDYDIVHGGYLSVTGLKRKNPDLKVLISVGGNRGQESRRFSHLISNGIRRRDFIRSAITFIKQFNFDGLDLHWQYPGAEELGGHATDKEYLGQFLEELSEVFKPKDWLLSISVPASRFRIESGFNPQRLADAVDFVNVQTYDFHRDRDPVADHHAPLNYRPHDTDLDLFYNIEYAVKYWLKKGLPRNKLNLGLPFFGRTFTLQNNNVSEIGAHIKGPGKEGFYTQNPGFLAYFEICDLILNEGLIRRTDKVGTPYVVHGDQWIGFDDNESIKKKIRYVKEMGLGGVFVWSLDLDDFKGVCGQKWPLITTIQNSLRSSKIASIYTALPTKPIGPCDAEGLFSDPKSCANYYLCRGGLSYHLSCGAHMLFDPNTGNCDYVEAKVCRPGQMTHIPNLFRETDKVLRSDKLVRRNTQKVVCYVTSWSFYRKGEGKFVPEYLDQRLCTHVVYAFASLDPEKLLMKEFDPWLDFDNDLYQRFTSLRDTEVLLALGGWTDSTGDKYSRLVKDPLTRSKFITSAIKFLKKHGFDGLHIDWTYPICWQSNCNKGPASDKPNFTKFIQELRHEFDNSNPPLTLAVSISGYKEVIDAAYNLPSLGKVVDFFSVMTYDYHGYWEKQTGHVSPLYERPGDKYLQYNTNFTMEYLISSGAPRDKLLVGVPLYGQSFTLARTQKRDQGVLTSGPGEPGEFTTQPGMLSYYEICSRIKNQHWQVNRDNYKATGPYAYNNDQWVGYEDVQSVKEKAEYIKNNGFGGAVAWTIDLDDFHNNCCQGSFPLLHSLNRGLGLISDGAVTHCTKPPEPVTPPAPTLTTGFDTGAQSSHHDHTIPSKPTTVTKPWWTSSDSTTTSPWWETSKVTSTKKPSTSSPPWWVPSTQKATSTTTKKATTSSTTVSSTTVSWETEGTTLPPPAVVAPGDTGVPEKCEQGQYLPDPHSCNAYYRCVLGDFKKQYCAGGLHWNKESGYCDWPATAKCSEQSSSGDQRPTTTFEQFTTKTTTTTTSTSSPETVDIPEHCTTGDYYPHKNCNNFYVCVNGYLVTQTCGGGLAWNMQSSTCDWSFKVQCINRKKLASETLHTFKEYDNDIAHRPYSTCEDGTFSAVKGDCTKYLFCLWGKYEEFECSPNLHWNSDRKICDWPVNAQCTEDNGEAEAITPPNKPETDVNPPQITPSTEAPPPPEQPPNKPQEPQSGYFKIVCYFTNWAWYRKGGGRYLPEDIDPNLCTHIVYGFAVLDYENLVIKAHDSWADYDNKFYERVVAFKKKGLKVSIALGGWNDSMGDKYSRLVNNPAARARFIKHVLEFLDQYGFEGLDLDWEYPKCWQVDCTKGPDSDKPAFAAFVKEIKEAFRPKGYLLSSAVSPSKVVMDAGYDVPTLGKYLDWIAVMTYDFHGQWDKKTGHVAPLYYHPDDEVAFYNSNYSINYWISEGVPRRKLVMGMPLYGQSFQLESAAHHELNANAPGPGQAGESTGAAGFLAYYEICDRVKNKGWTVVNDPKHRMGPYAYKGNQWVSFDDQNMIKIKSEYVRKMDLGGAMIWALDLDDFKNKCGGGKHPLLSIIRHELAGPGSGTPEFIDDNDNEPHIGQQPTEPTKEIEVPQTPKSVVDRNSPFKVVCYFTNWAWYRQGVGKFLPSDIDPDLCTHIVYGFAVLNGDQLVIKPHDTWADFDNKFYEKVTALRAKGIKVLIAIGGWNDSAGDKYSKLVNNPSARRRFIAHVLEFIEANGFDGLDLDWEYPKCWQVDCSQGPDSDKSAFASFIQELHESFSPKGLLLSAAVSPSKRVVDAGYDVPALSRYLDWIAVMCYDYHGQWDKITGHVAPMYAHPDDIDVTFNANYTIHYWISQGADRKKIVMGLPMYGQSFSLADNSDTGLNAPTYGGGEAGEETRARGFLAYYEICSYIQKKGWVTVHDKKNRIGPYAYLRDQWVSYDDVPMIQHKSEYIKQMGLGGGMIWALDLDDFKNICGCENYPLLRTINRVLRNYSVSAPVCKLGVDQPQKPKPAKPAKPSTQKPVESWETTKRPIEPVEPWEPTQKPTKPSETPQNIPCNGALFLPHKENCNQYYLCNQDKLMLLSCSDGLFWNHDHCDWPENTKCHPDATTTESQLSGEPSEHTPFEEFPLTPEPSTTRPIVTDTGYKVICYFTNWAWYRPDSGKYVPEDIDPNLCTHITYGFAVLDANTLTIKPHDSWADIDNGFYKKVTSYRSLGIKVLIALGGWNDSLGNKYSRLVNSPSARANFINDIVRFIEIWEFDGLDLDWEYPKCWQVDCNKGPQSDKAGFAALISELSNAFKPRGWLLSAAVSPSKSVIDAGYDVPTLSQYFDWIAVMTYDFHGHWDKQTGHVSPLYYYPGDLYDYFNSNFSMHYWLELGAAPSKLVMGMPLYGQSFTLVDANNYGLNEKSYGPGEGGEFTRAGGFLAFYEICERVKRRSWSVVRDPQGRIGPYAHNGNQWVSYDDISEIRRKSKFIKDLGLGGGMIWALDLDDFKNTCGCGKHPLLKTLNNELRGTQNNINTINCT